MAHVEALPDSNGSRPDRRGIAGAQPPAPAAEPTKVTAIKAGGSIDPETGTAATNQVILIEGEKIKEVGPTVKIPPGAEVIDLSKLTVLPGLVDAHTHMAITYKEQPENNYYYLTYVMESTPLRAIQAASNGIQMLSSGLHRGARRRQQRARTPTRRCGRRSSRAGCRGRRSSRRDR